MRAGFIEKPEVAYFIDNAKEPQIVSPADVKIQVKAVGICGSEVHAYHGKHPFRIPPIVSGHEFAGVITEVGSAVKSYKSGDRVTAEPHFGCGECTTCQNGKYNICKNKKILGAYEWSGPFGEYIVVPEKTLVRLDDKISFEQGALIEPIAVGMHAARESKVSVGKNVLIVGAGTIGFGLLLSAKLFNPSKIIMVDVVDFNLDTAKAMGCEYTINSAKNDLEACVNRITNGIGADVTFLAFGNSDVMESAAKCTRSGGTIMDVAIMANGVGAPLGLLQNKELKIQGSNMYVYEDFKIVMEAIGKGLMPLNNMITHVYPIEQMEQAMEMADKRTEDVIKVIMTF